MPYGEVRLVSGINVERTPTLLEAGYAQSAFGRFKDSLFQKLGGWQKYFPNTVSGTPRDLHAWQDLNQTNHLGVGTTSQLGVITSGSLTDITPQTKTTNPSLSFTTTTGSAAITVVDTGIANVTVFDSIFLNTPISVGGLILSGLYPIASIGGSTSYTITAAGAATSAVTTGGAVPIFAISTGSAFATVSLPNHGQSVGGTVVFPISTAVGSSTVSGSYTVNSVNGTASFTITLAQQAASATTASMNSGSAQIVYYITLGPSAAG